MLEEYDIRHGQEPIALLRSEDRISWAIAVRVDEVLGDEFSKVESAGDKGSARLTNVHHRIVFLRKFESSIISRERADVGSQEQVESKDAFT